MIDCELMATFVIFFIEILKSISLYFEFYTIFNTANPSNLHFEDLLQRA